jgi:7,8-dihydropterin-6-yl-methyl-4-(beta-D-ribofuranosyl)aminobenzene 5'-phosphate synthase
MNFSKAKILILAVLMFVFCFHLLFGGPQAAGVQPAPVLTVLYDNYVFQDGCAADWGFAAIIEGFQKTILFDSGTKEDVFLKNVTDLNVDLKKVDLVFISHDHGDHTGGLPAFFKVKSGLPVYVPFGANPAFQSSITQRGGNLIAVKESLPIFPGVFSTGDLGEAIHEQAIVIDSPEGLVVVTGCAHPGIVLILEKVKEIWKKDIRMVLGGFHLVQTPPAEVEKIVARFKELGVKRVGATHCTGAPAIEMFRKAFGPDFVELGVGRKITIGS